MNPPRKSNQGRRLLGILVQTVEIGIILSLGVGLFFLWQQWQTSSQQSVSLQATVAALENERLQLLNQPTATVAAPTELEGIISFSDPMNPTELNSALSWQQGGSPTSAYDLTLEPGTLTLTSAPDTDQWAAKNTGPVVVLRATGDFDVSVKVKTSPVEDYQRAGIGVRSARDSSTWVTVTRNFHSTIPGNQGIMVLANQHGTGSLVNSVPFPAEVCFFKIVRRGSELSLSYSEDGVNWTVLHDNYATTLVDPVEIFLGTSSTGGRPLTAQFSELTLFRPQ